MTFRPPVKQKNREPVEGSLGYEKSAAACSASMGLQQHTHCSSELTKNSASIWSLGFLIALLSSGQRLAESKRHHSQKYPQRY